MRRRRVGARRRQGTLAAGGCLTCCQLPAARRQCAAVSHRLGAGVRGGRVGLSCAGACWGRSALRLAPGLLWHRTPHPPHHAPHASTPPCAPRIHVGPKVPSCALAGRQRIVSAVCRGAALPARPFQRVYLRPLPPHPPVPYHPTPQLLPLLTPPAPPPPPTTAARGPLLRTVGGGCLLLRSPSPRCQPGASLTLRATCWASSISSSLPIPAPPTH